LAVTKFAAAGELALVRASRMFNTQTYITVIGKLGVTYQSTFFTWVVGMNVILQTLATRMARFRVSEVLTASAHMGFGSVIAAVTK
jgi:hypothetical protein